jgi:hypothetical protein
METVVRVWPVDLGHQVLAGLIGDLPVGHELADGRRQRRSGIRRTPLLPDDHAFPIAGKMVRCGSRGQE